VAASFSIGISVGKSGVIHTFGGVLTSSDIVVHHQSLLKIRVLGSGKNHQKR